MSTTPNYLVLKLRMYPEGGTTAAQADRLVPTWSVLWQDELDLKALGPGDYAVYEAKGNALDDGLTPRYELVKRSRVSEPEEPSPTTHALKTLPTDEKELAA